MIRLFSKLREAQKFLDEQLFDAAGQYAVYRCKRVRQNQLTTCAILLASGYYVYQLVADEEEEFAGNLLLTLVTGAAFAIHSFRMRRSLKRLTVHRAGPWLEVELYDWMGLGSRQVRLESEEVIGMTAFLDRKLKMPAVLYREPGSGKRQFLLYRTEGIEDRETFEVACGGKPFKVLPRELHVEAKKKRML